MRHGQDRWEHVGPGKSQEPREVGELGGGGLRHAVGLPARECKTHSEGWW